MPTANPSTTPTISVQLYSVREELQRDADGTYAALAAMGVTTVEAFDFVADPTAYKARLDAHGLRAATGHAMFLTTEPNEHLTVLPLEQSLEAAATLGLQYLIDPAVMPDRWGSLDDIRRTADRMAEAVEAAEAYGVQLGYHNHGFELAMRVDDRPVLEVFAELAPAEMRLEIDLYWASIGGADPADLVTRLGDRVVAAHVKDGALGHDPLAFETPKDQVPAGQGEVPLTAALDAATALEFAVIEFDHYEGPILEGVRQSAAFLSERGLR